MMDLPRSLYLAQGTAERALELVPEEAKHICIDGSPEADLVLRLTLAKRNILPSDAPKLYGYAWTDNATTAYYFLNEEQHLALQELRNKETPCQGEENGTREEQ